MTDEQNKALKALLALIELTEGNFPAGTQIRINTVSGSNGATIIMEASLLRSLLKQD